MSVTLVGMGIAPPLTLTNEAEAALRSATVIIGAERLLAGLPPGCTARAIACAHPDAMAEAIAALPHDARVCVALSGDAGFFSAAQRLAERLGDPPPARIAGVATPQYFAARLGRPWQDFRLISAHGRRMDAVAEALNHPAALFLTGGDATPAAIAAELAGAELGDAILTVGENLGGPEERISRDTAAALAGRSFAPLSVVLVENRATFARPPAPPGIPDEAFQRGDTPMTKREIRVQALSLLRPAPDAVIYDIGAGTGSLAVEAALQARRGRVYAIERDAAALALIARNRRAFGVYNITVVAGTAPEALADLPRPDAAFIGGSGGGLPAIAAALLAANPRVRLVIAAVTLETLDTAVRIVDDARLADIEAIQVAVSRAVPRAGRRMVAALNPVFLISGGGDDGSEQ